MNVNQKAQLSIQSRQWSPQKKMNKVIDIDAVFPKSPIRLSKKRMATYGASNKHHWSIPVQATPTSIIIIGVRGQKCKESSIWWHMALPLDSQNNIVTFFSFFSSYAHQSTPQSHSDDKQQTDLKSPKNQNDAA